MTFKAIAALVALVLVIAYLWPPVYKLKDAALGIVALVGIVLMAVDLVQSLKSKED